MTITREAVRHVAKLANLALDEDECDRLQAELARILEHVGELERLDTASVPPTTSVAVDAAPLRLDLEQTSVSQEQALREAPRTSQGGFAVPAFKTEEP